MTGSFSLKKLLYSLYLVVCLGLALLLVLGVKQYQLYNSHKQIIAQTEKLLFQFSIIREHITLASIDTKVMGWRGLPKEVETLNYNLTQILNSGDISEEFKLSLINSIDLKGMVLILRKIEAGEDRVIDIRNLNKEVRTLGERLILFDRILVNSTRDRLISFQNLVIGACCMAISLLVGLLVHFHRRLLAPIWVLVAESEQLLAGERNSVTVSSQSEEAIVLAQIINEQQSLKGAMLGRLDQCREVGGNMVASLGGLWAELDSDGLICRVNPEFEESLGYQAGQLSGKKWPDVFKVPSRLVIGSIEELVASGPIDMTIAGRSHELNRVMRCCFLMSFCGDERCVIRCLGYDITADKTQIAGLESDLEEQKTRKTEALRVSQLTSIGELACGVAHEMSITTNSIINIAQVLVDQALDRGDEDDELLKAIIMEGDKITGLAGNLLAYGQDDGKARDLVEISDVLDNSIALMTPLFKQDSISVIVDTAELPAWSAPAQKIQQIFLAILLNSRLAMNLGADNGLKKTITIFSKPSETGFSLVFKDNGVGIGDIPPEKLFTPGFSGWPGDISHAGMGLAIAREVSAELNGDIDIQSPEEQGAVVTLSLAV